jgi:hypothetical protein
MEDFGCELSDTFKLFHPLISDVTQVRRKAIISLNRWVEGISAKEAVIIAKRYGVSSWLQSAYIRLLDCSPIDLADLGFDWETIARLLWVKQRILVHHFQCSRYRCECGNFRNGVVSSCPCPVKMLSVVKPMVEGEFRKDFDSMTAAMDTEP